jgi:hypothetical protein
VYLNSEVTLSAAVDAKPQAGHGGCGGIQPDEVELVKYDGSRWNF